MRGRSVTRNKRGLDCGRLHLEPCEVPEPCEIRIHFDLHLIVGKELCHHCAPAEILNRLSADNAALSVVGVRYERLVSRQVDFPRLGRS